MNIAIPPSTGMQYRLAEMQFWNEHLPKMLLHPGKDIPLPIRPKGPRPQILDIADGIGKYANASRDYDTYGSRLVTFHHWLILESIPSQKFNVRREYKYHLHLFFFFWTYIFFHTFRIVHLRRRFKNWYEIHLSLNFEILLWNIDGIFK